MPVHTLRSMLPVPIVALLMASVSNEAWSAPVYQFETFTVPDSFATFGSGINDAGRVAGTSSQNVTENQHSFVREADGTVTSFDPPGTNVSTLILNFRGSAATGINDAGVVAGSFTDDLQRVRGYLRAADGLSYTSFDVVGWLNLFTGAVNAAGALVGAVTQSSLNISDPADVVPFSAFVRDGNGNTTVFDVPGAIQSGTSAAGINDAGRVVGSYEDALGKHGFLRQTDGSLATIDVPGALWTQAFEIDNLDRIVGMFEDAGGVHAFVRSSNGDFQGFDVPGPGLGITGINDLGWVSGPAFGGGPGFIGRPVSEPPASALFVLAALLGGAASRRATTSAPAARGSAPRRSRKPPAPST